MPNTPEWRIEGPDAEGKTWLHWQAPPEDPKLEKVSLNLGAKEDVEEAFSQWLASVEEREPD